MPRTKLEKVTRIFASEYWLVVCLCGAFFSFFALNRGGVIVFIDASFVFLLFNFLADKYRLRNIPASYWITVAVCAYLLGASVLLHPQVSHYRWMANLVRMLCVVFAIHCLSHKTIPCWTTTLFFAVLTLAVCWQAAAYYIFEMEFGTFSNEHYLSSFATLTLPVIVCAFLVTRVWYRYAFLPVALMDIDIILKLYSRPAILGITVGTFFVLILLTKGRRRWGSLLLLGTILAGVLITNYGDVFSRFENLIVTLPEEERIKVWISAWKMLKDNSWSTWLFGNGIGGYRRVYLQYSAPEVVSLIFPHLHLIEVCYENGIIGMILVFGGFAGLLISAMKAASQAVTRNNRILIKCLIVALLSWLIHAGLTLPFYSKYAQYSLAFILGTLLTLIGNRESPKSQPIAFNALTRPPHTLRVPDSNCDRTHESDGFRLADRKPCRRHEPRQGYLPADYRK
jgi:hypothetical protein